MHLEPWDSTKTLKLQHMTSTECGTIAPASQIKTNVHVIYSMKLGGKKGNDPWKRQLTKLRSKCQTRCWSNMDQDSVTALSISCLRCCQKHILVCCLAVIWENLWHNRNLGNGRRGHRGTHICWHAHVVGPTTKTKPRSSDKKNTQRKHDLILCSHHHYFTTSLQRNELFADLLRLNIVAVFK